MSLGTILAVYLVSLGLGVAIAAALPRTRWWVGLIACGAFGPCGLVMIAVDVATFRGLPAQNTENPPRHPMKG